MKWPYATRGIQMKDLISREVFFIQGIPLAEQMLKQGKWFEGESALGNVFLHMVAFQTQF